MRAKSNSPPDAPRVPAVSSNQIYRASTLGPSFLLTSLAISGISIYEGRAGGQEQQLERTAVIGRKSGGSRPVMETQQVREQPRCWERWERWERWATSMMSSVFKGRLRAAEGSTWSWWCSQVAHCQSVATKKRKGGKLLETPQLEYGTGSCGSGTKDLTLASGGVRLLLIGDRLQVRCSPVHALETGLATPPSDRERKQKRGRGASVEGRV